MHKERINSVNIIGGGMWGLALAATMQRNDINVQLFCHSIQNTSVRIHEYCNDITFSLLHLGKLKGKVGNTLNFIVLPAQTIRAFISEYKEEYDENSGIVICSKGIEKDTGLFLSEIISEEIGLKVPLGVLAGPNFSIDVLNGIHTSTTISSTDLNLKKNTLKVLSSNSFTLEESNDLIGSQLCSALKNIYAIGAGFTYFQYIREKYGIENIAKAENAIRDNLIDYSNLLASFLTDSFREFREIFKALCDIEHIDTTFNYCGIGDFLLSCSSSKSRNFQLGYHTGLSTLNYKPSYNREIHLSEGYFSIQGLINRMLKYDIEYKKYKILNSIVELMAF
ncbi:NAD(P)H-dependent glycerol-3-phosphate dehydrogenase [Candidatus Fokinia crypta]|uniref:NAD(P)-dependent glycerol-3-phosphate dehydrogenase n=1 Tax=Candidatus Fokinia crypta TaxID=1920990 RepID=A0ABZ0UQ55_9RICK|nr:NAD(P)H-dependent glycerol-3-phosphate dehydrogenase [Candidatus Fokinia cryptica]WPX97834.1 NAD(P)-dependent glycerol-3-phosphate dehydrogenase [Candidatus Fokinia cryptica]